MIRRNHNLVVSLLALSLILTQLLACSDRLQESDPINQLPDTTVEATPPVAKEGGRSISISWSGSDTDGTIESFQYRVLEADLSRRDVAWIETRELGIELEFSAKEVEAGRDRILTLQVRAVDDKGGIDASPAGVSFSPFTLAPIVTIELPPLQASITCTRAPLVPIFGWTALDPDVRDRMPAATRYILLELEGESCLTQLEFELDNPLIQLPTDDPRWSEWIPYEGATTVVLPRQDVDKRFLFAVQALDRDGAITKEFGWNQNVRHFQTTDSLFPVLTAYEEFLGTSNFVHVNGLKQYEIVAGQPLSFSWQGDASDYGGTIDAYRWGWNIVDPEDPNDPGWAVPWGNGPQWQEAPTRSFAQGSPNFVAQVRDHAGTISRATYQFQVLQVPPRDQQRDLLFVDDWPSGGTSSEQQMELLWDAQWELLLTHLLPNFQIIDMLDAQDEPQRLTASLVLQYKAVVWFVSPSQDTFLHTRFAPAAPTLERYNWMEAYQKTGGNLLLVGPGAMLNSIEDKPWLFPVIFDTAAGGNLGFGTYDLPGGEEINRGTRRWPYSAFCLEAIDFIRPPIGSIFAETGPLPRRSTQCDAILQAEIAWDFLFLHPEAEGFVTSLRPTAERETLHPAYRLGFEEFYNRNVTPRRVPLTRRDCHVPMFRMLSRRDEGLIEDPEQNCYPQGSEASALGYAPVAVMSTVYRDTKPLAGSADFVWGFHPLAFEQDDVRAALRWIFKRNWELPTN